MQNLMKKGGSRGLGESLGWGSDDREPHSGTQES